MPERSAAPRGENPLSLREAGVHLVNHLTVMADLNKQGRCDRTPDDLFKLTGEMPASMHDFVKLHAAEFTRRETTALAVHRVS